MLDVVALHDNSKKLVRSSGQHRRRLVPMVAVVVIVAIAAFGMLGTLNFVGCHALQSLKLNAARIPKNSGSLHSHHSSRITRHESSSGIAFSVDTSPFAKLTVGELKQLLSARGVDYRDCFDKRDLVERLAEAEARLSADYGVPVQTQLTAGERSMVNLFQQCSQSVAFIETTQIGRPYGLSLNPQQIPAGAGSGFVWDMDGHVITNYHVIRNAQSAKVTIGKGTQAYDAKLIGAEPELDIAVLKVAAPGSVLRPVAVGNSAQLQVGQSVLAIGNPFGLDQTLTTGVVSALGREVDGVAGNKIQGCIQTDAAINPGNSGGPLLDSAGKLIGVNTAIFSPSGASAGIGFAIPVDSVRRVVNQIIRFGRARRASLGVNLASDQNLKQIAQQMGKQLKGALVLGVSPGSPAERAGIQPCMRMHAGLQLGDLIVKLNGTPVAEVEDLTMAIDSLEVGQTVVVGVLRGCKGAEETVTLQLAERPASKVLAPGQRNAGTYVSRR